MFGRAKPFEDPHIGRLRRSRGAWRGSITLGAGVTVPLVVPGPGSEPDAGALALARTIPAEFERTRELVAAALAEHRAAALDGAMADEADLEASPSSVAIVELDRALVIQVAYQVSWDDDHTLGACVRDGRLIELNGSILEP